MDIYMDRLAQRITAQDIIQANTVADMEEMNKLKAQIAEYHRCLEELKRLMDEEAAKLRTSQMSGENVNRLVDEGIEKIRAIQADSRGGEELQLKLSQQLNTLEMQVGNKLDALQKQVNDKLEILQQAGGRIDALEQVGGKLDAIEQQVGGKLDAIEQQIGGRLDALGQQVGEKLGAMEQQMSDQLGSMNQQVGEKLNGMNRQVGTTMEKLERRAEAPKDLDENKLTEKFATLEDNVHKECVKVYRNVQAVVVEENTKQSDAMTETMTAVGKMKGKTGAILGISAAALLASLGSIILQLMQVLGIF